MTAFDATVDIERVVAGGDGLARHESLVVFIPRTLGGERVRASVTVKGKLARGTLLGIERASPARITPACEHYIGDGCGGCQLQHATYEEQLEAKRQIVAESFRRIARLDVDVPPVHSSSTEWRYRRKLTLAMRRKGASWFAGLRRFDNPDAVFALRDCPITEERVVSVWRDVLSAAAFLPQEHELRGAVRVDPDGATSFVLEGGTAWTSAQQFFGAVPSLHALWWAPERRPRLHLFARPTHAGASIGASFAQVNPLTADLMLEYVLGRVRAHTPEHVVDAYAGTGDTSAGLSGSGIRVTAIELDRDAAKWAEHRVTAPSRVIADRVERALPGALPADVVVLNPPRSGVDVAVCSTLAPRRDDLRAIIYVSCDPATLARDVSRLPGWRPATIRCFDMFPQTAHVETVCELTPTTRAA